MPFACFSLRRFALALVAVALACAGCAPSSPPPPAASAQPAAPDPVYYRYTIVNAFPHDRSAFTEGLVYWSGNLYESTGLLGESSLREVDLDSGKVLRQIPLSSEYFGEGLTILGDKAYQLTWKNHLAFCYDVADFHLEKTFPYDAEGWGLTTDGQSLIASDGTSQIRFIDPATFTTQRSIDVELLGQPVRELNELEYIQGEIYANIWQTNNIVRIDPKDGRVLGIIDFTGLLPAADRAPDTDVLNGIAYDAAHDRLFVTGKKWPWIYEVKLSPLKQAAAAANNSN
jgi:glutamine cyclotransferase